MNNCQVLKSHNPRNPQKPSSQSAVPSTPFSCGWVAMAGQEAKSCDEQGTVFIRFNASSSLSTSTNPLYAFHMRSICNILFISTGLTLLFNHGNPMIRLAVALQFISGSAHNYGDSANKPLQLNRLLITLTYPPWWWSAAAAAAAGSSVQCVQRFAAAAKASAEPLTARDWRNSSPRLGSSNATFSNRWNGLKWHKWNQMILMDILYKWI